MLDSDDAEGGVELLGARSVNTHAYCPRRYWLEEVARVRVENDQVMEGLGAHKRVDRPGGKLAAPPAVEDKDGKDEDAPPWHARSLWLSSTALGVTAKLDFVDTGGPSVIPVDTKKGRAPDGGGLWPADAIQLTLQALLLREAGYTCAEVAAWYVASRRKVTVTLTAEMEATARQEIDAARATALLGAPPLPLVDSPKCAKCSIHAACLPDETNTLLSRGRCDSELSRVVPPNDDALAFYVTDHSARVGVSKERLTVQFRDEARKPVAVPLHQVASLNVLGNAQVSMQAMHACLDAGIPVNFMTGGGYFLGRAQGDGAALLHVRRAQFAEAEGVQGLGIARILVADKIFNVRTLLRRNHDDVSDGRLEQLKSLSEDALRAEDRAALLALEGEAAKKSWAEYSALLAATDPAFAMAGRTRRPPRDRTNALLGFTYALLLKDCVHAVIAAGLDPYLGVYHTAHHGRPSMALDLMEPFRPLVADSVVLSIVNRREVDARGFVDTGQAVVMQPGTRKALISAYERRVSEEISHPLFGYRISYRQVLGVQARLLARALTRELPAMASFRTR